MKHSLLYLHVDRGTTKIGVQNEEKLCLKECEIKMFLKSNATRTLGDMLTFYCLLQVSTAYWRSY